MDHTERKRATFAAFLIAALALPLPAYAGGATDGLNEYQRPSIIKVECPDLAVGACCDDDCKPGRLVGASLGLAASVATLATGIAFSAQGFAKGRTDDRLRRQQRTWGLSLDVAGAVGLITSAIAVRRARQARDAAGCDRGSFRKDRGQ